MFKLFLHKCYQTRKICLNCLAELFEQAKIISLFILSLQAMAQTGFGRRYFKAFVSGFFVAVPVTVTVLDRLAYVARVEGASMQVGCLLYNIKLGNVVLINLV